MTTTDPTRSPAGTESAWAYTHLPRGVTGAADADELAERAEAVVEAHAPGFRDRILHRAVQRPADLAADDANLGDGAVNGGTAQLFQQLVFRPTPGLGRPETPIEPPLPRQRRRPPRRRRARRLRLPRRSGRAARTTDARRGAQARSRRPRSGSCTASRSERRSMPESRV